MARKVLIQNTEADPVMSYEDVAVLTGTETVGRQVYVGDDDPAILHAADLIPGDRWTDTTIVSGWPFVEKVRNLTNDGWDFAGLVLTVDGKVRGVVRLEPAGTTIARYDENELELSRIEVTDDGTARMSRYEGGSIPTSSVILDIDGSAAMATANGSILISPAGDIFLNNTFGNALLLGADGTLNFGGNPIGTQAANVSALVGDDPADTADAVRAILLALKASGEMAADA